MAPNGLDHDRIIVAETKVDHIIKVIERTENKLDIMDARIRGKVGWLHLGIMAAIVSALIAAIKYAAPAIASIIGAIQ